MSDSENAENNKQQEIKEKVIAKGSTMNTSAVVINGPEPMQFDDPGKYWSRGNSVLTFICWHQGRRKKKKM